MNRFVVFIFALISLCLQHPLHEYAHVIVAKLLGEKVIRIQWLTYHGGTRVFYENEPSFETIISKKWALIAGAGYIVTNCLAYIFVYLYIILPFGLIKAFVCILSIVFLLCDSLYFVLGSIMNFGDIVGIQKTLKLPRWLCIFLCFMIFTLNITLVKVIFY